MWLHLQVKQGGAPEERRALVRAAQPRWSVEGEALPRVKLAHRHLPFPLNKAERVLPHGFPTSKNLFLFLGESQASSFLEAKQSSKQTSKQRVPLLPQSRCHSPQRNEPRYQHADDFSSRIPHRASSCTLLTATNCCGRPHECSVLFLLAPFFMSS